MPYSDEHFDRMESDPVLRRQYAWQVGQKALLDSVALRQQCKLTEAQLRAIFGRLVLDNLDFIAA